MFIVENYQTAVFFCVITMLCWGSWANTQKIAGDKWRFELFYWDYVIGIFFLSLVSAFTIGSIGTGGRSFIADWSQAHSSYIGSALLGGILFNAANILLVAAISLSGMSVAFPLGIGIALILGVVVNYWGNPVGNLGFLSLGVLLVATAILLNAKAYANQRSHENKSSSKKGLFLAIVAGILMGLFYKYVAASMFTKFEMPEAGKLSPYTAVVVFSFGILISNFLFNTLLMKKPFSGTPLTFSHYISGTLKQHSMGILGGIIWCIGMSFSILASDQAGPAISYGLGQGATVVAAIWGIYIWKEFKGSSNQTKTLLYLMLIAYVLGLACIIFSR